MYQNISMILNINYFTKKKSAFQSQCIPIPKYIFKSNYAPNQLSFVHKLYKCVLLTCLSKYFSANLFKIQKKLFCLNPYRYKSVHCDTKSILANCDVKSQSKSIQSQSR